MLRALQRPQHHNAPLRAGSPAAGPPAAGPLEAQAVLR